MSKLEFVEVSLKETRKGWCKKCGNRTSRTTKVFQTLNPFNKNERGVPKSRGEILAELRVEIVAKRAKPLLCSRCERLF